jgi:hypothetical protein
MAWLRALKFSHHALSAPTATKSKSAEPAVLQPDGDHAISQGKLMGVEDHGTAKDWRLPESPDFAKAKIQGA